MLSIVILICASTVERSDCTPQTAVIAMAAPPASSAAGCGLGAQSLLASQLRLEPGRYVKVVCTRGVRATDEARLSAGH